MQTELARAQPTARKPSAAAKKLPPAPKPAARSVFAAPLPTAPLHQAVHQARQKVRQAEDQITAKGSAPLPLKHYPTLGTYTPAQRRAILQSAQPLRKMSPAQKQAAADYLNLGDRDTRRQLHKIMGAQQTLTNRVAEHVGAATLHGQGYKVDLSHRGTRGLARTVGLQQTGAAQSTAKAIPKVKRPKFGGTSKLAGLPVPGLHQLGVVAGDVMGNITRPGAFVLGAADAVAHPSEHREGVLKTATDNFKTQKISGSDIVRGTGAGKTAAAILGAGVDIGADPLNLVTAGAAPVATHGTELATRALRISEALHDAGKPAEAAHYADEAAKLAAKAKDLPHNRGIQVRIGTRRAGFKTSGASTAKLAQALHLPAVGGAVHDSRLVQTLGRNVHAAFRPADVSAQDWTRYRDLERQARGEIHASGRQWERRGHAVNRLLKGQSHRDVLDVLENTPGAPLYSDLSPEQKEAVDFLRDSYHGMAKAEHGAGLLGESSKPLADATRQNYSAHILSGEARKGATKGKGKLKSPYSLARKHEGTTTEINDAVHAATGAHLFEENNGAILAERGSRAAAAVHNKQYQDAVVKNLGRIVPNKAHQALAGLADNEALYIHGDGGLRKLSDRPSEAAEQIKGIKPNKKREVLVALPREIGDRAVRGPIGGRQLHARELEDLTRTHAKLMQRVKAGLTVLNAPAYQLRNFAGDTWNSRLAGTDLRSSIDGARVIVTRGQRNHHELRHLAEPFHADHMVDLGHGREIHVTDLIHEMESHGVIGSGFHQGDLADLQRLSNGHYAALDTKGAHPIKRLYTIGGAMEDTPRAGTYLAARRRGLTPAEAARWTAQHHFDYGDLTDFERNHLRTFFPFWTFTARNTPLQAKRLVTRPGQFANYSATQEEGRKQAGLPKNYALPSNFSRSFAIPLNVHGHRVLLDPRLPLTDLQRTADLKNPAAEFKDTAQMLTPLLKNPIEMAANYSLFFRQPIYQDAQNPSAPHYTAGPKWLLDKIPTKAARDAVKLALAGGNKDAADRNLITTKADYVLRTMPQSNLATQVASAGVGSRSQSAGNAIASQLTGVKVNDYSPQQAAKNRIQQLYTKSNELEAQWRDARKFQEWAKARALNRKRYALLKDIRSAKVKAGLPVAPTAPKKAKKLNYGSSYGTGYGTSYGSGKYGGS